MATLNKTEAWNVGKAGAACACCGAAMAAGDGCWAALVEGAADQTVAEKQNNLIGQASTRNADGGIGTTGIGTAGVLPFARVDFCDACWGAGKRPDPAKGQGELFSFWKTQVPTPTQKKKLFVEDSVLVDLFTRLEGKEAGEDVRFRFVLALILMRKRLLRYEGMEETGLGHDEAAATPEVWTMIPRGVAGGEGAKAVRVVNPQLTPEQISEVSGQLSGILAEEV